MLDINKIRENKEEIQKNLAKRGGDFDVDEIIALDIEKRKLLTEVEQLKAEKNRVSTRRPLPEEIEKMRQVGNRIKELDEKVRQTEENLKSKLLKLPNIPFDNVPMGDELANVVIKKVGNIPNFKFKAKDHLELGEKLDIIDIERAQKVSGTRFAYLKNEAVLIELALVNFIIKLAQKEKFIPIIPPVLIRGGNLEELGYDMGNYYLVSDERCPHPGCNHAISGRGKIFCEECNDYKETEIVFEEGADRLKCHKCGKATRLTYFYLIGTAEHAIAPMHSKEVFNENDLPKRYIGFSSAFRREAGSYGKDTRGILRVHQFDKVELFSFCHPDKSKEEHKFLVDFEEKLWQALKIPYQLVQLSTGDMSKPSASTIDIEAWLPSQNMYREVSSASNTTDFQARRLNIRYKTKSGKPEFVHMLNATGFPIGRTLIAILENYQQKDGSVKVPKVLHKFGAPKIIKLKK